MTPLSEPEARNPAAALESFAKTTKKTKKRRNPPSGGTHAGQPPPKRPKTAPSSGPLQVPNAVKHAVLAQYYPTTLPLRQYLLDNLPASSRLRRRKIAAVGSESSTDREPDGIRAQLARLLDTTLVGLHVPPKDLAKAQSESRLQQWIDYSQRDDSHATLSGGGDASAVHFQSEVGLTMVVQGQGGSRAFTQACIRSRLTDHGRLWISLFACYFHERRSPSRDLSICFAMASARAPVITHLRALFRGFTASTSTRGWQISSRPHGRSSCIFWESPVRV